MIEANEARRRLLAGGYSPLPLIGKRPVFDDWQKRIDVTEHEIEYWSRSAPAAANTGILTKFVPTLDIDLLDTTAAVAVEQLARERFEEQGPVLTRTGAPPRRAVPFRSDAPFGKIKVDLIAPDGSTGQKLEFLGDGQQVVVHGIHPDTHKPYIWTGDAPGQIARQALPYIHACEAQALIDDAAGLLVAQFGYRLAKAKARKAANGAGEDELAGWAIDFGDHDALVALAMKLLRTGMRDGAVVNFLRAQVEGLTGVEEDRKARRLKEIPAMVASARAKFDTEAAPAEPSPNGGKAAPSLLVWYGAEPPPPPQYLVRNTLPETGVAMIAGQTTLGKTFIGADLSGAVMTGDVFAGEPVMRRGGVLWFAAEGEKDIEARVRAAVENKYGGSGPQPFARQAEAVPLLTDPGALERLKAHAREAERHMQAAFGLPLALIAVDTVSAAAGFVDENSASETQKVMTLMQALSRETGALVAPIDHYGKVDETGIRGSSAKSAAADVILACLGVRDKEGNVSNQRLAVAKIRNGPAGRVIPFELRATGETCTVEWRLDGLAIEEAEKPKERWPKTLAIFKRALDYALVEFGVRARPFLDGPELLTVDREKVRNEFMRSYPADNRKTKGEAWRRYEKEAVSRGIIGSRSGTDEPPSTVFWLIHEEPKP